MVFFSLTPKEKHIKTRPCNEMGHSYSWLRGKNPMFTRGQISIEHNLTKLIPPVAVTQGSIGSSLSLSALHLLFPPSYSSHIQ